jgi:hypothetical protein
VTASFRLSFAPAARGWRVVALVFALVGADAIANTYSSFSNTLEEPAHIAAGAEWLSAGRYDEDVARPPLGRIAAAVGPYLRGARSLGSASPLAEGLRILGTGAHYRDTLDIARLGELPFFLLLCGVVWAWGRRLGDERGGALAVLLLASNPNVLAHAALATPAIALAATVTAAFFAFACWLDSPGVVISLALGIAAGLAAVSDFAALAYLGLALPAMYLVRRAMSKRNPLWPDGTSWRAPLSIGVIVASAMLAGWAVYRFDVGPVVEGSWVRLPAPMWFRGVATYLRDVMIGNPAFFFGRVSSDGWWYYYPVALLVKTPLPLLLLSVIGAAAAMADIVRRGRWHSVAPLCGLAAVLVIAAIRSDDTGIGRVLTVFPLLAVVGSYGAVALWERGARTLPALRFGRIAVAVTLVAAAIVPMRVHPDYLAYFNAIAGDSPERLLVDSNLDWGQDLYRLGAVMKRLHIESMRLAYFGSAPLGAAGVRNVRLLRPGERPRGWIAASETMLAGVGADGAFEWLNELRPIGRVGSSIVLFYVPPPPPIRLVRSRAIR